MGVPILVCDCGLRLKAPGATPGRVGRCPECGAMLRVPEGAVTARSAADGLPSAADPALESAPQAPERSRTDEPSPVRGRRRARTKGRDSMADGLLPPLRNPETWWLPCLLYPLRGAECMGLAAILGVVYWAFTILIPEYCLTLMADADSMGARFMGWLIALITSLPTAILLPPAIFYGLQYLGRVLVSSAQGDTIPPRPPDRNFEGFLNGLSPWCLWLLFGGSVGLLPLVAYNVLAPAESWNRPTALALVLAGFPYLLMALMMVFLHDDVTAARPTGVLGAMGRLCASYWATCLAVAGLIGAGIGAFALAFMLRERLFWLYIGACLVCWIAALGLLIAVMRILGTYYYRHRDVLRWHRDRPRWGVAWKL